MAKRKKSKQTKPKQKTIVAAAVNATCPNCVYYNAPDTSCRHNAPMAELTGNPSVIWPEVAATDWCAEGYSVAFGWYDQAPISRSV